MAGDVVFMDVLPSLSGFAKELATGTHKAATDTGKTAGGAWSKAFSQTAGDSGSDAVVAELAANEEKAKRSVQSATTEISKARAAQREAAARVIDQEAKYQAAVEKSKAAADGTAEQQAQAQAKVEAASLRLEAAREKERIAAGKVDGAESGLRAAYRESEEAAKQLAAATDEAAKAAAEGGKEAKESESKWGGVGSAIGALPGKVKDFAGSLGGVVTAAAGAVGAAAAFSEGWEQALDLSTGTAKVEAALGLTEQQSAAAGEAAGTLYADNYGESMDDVTGAVESVMSSFAGMRDASTADLEKVTGQAMSVAKAFDVDVDEAVAASAQLINQGLAGDATEAFDLMTASLQKVPKALRGEVMDATGEYSQFFSQLGIDGPEAMGLLAAASEDGQYGIDKMGDALKELTIRSTDMSTTSVAAYEAAGLSAEDMSAKFLAGGDTARGAFDELIAGLQGIEDPTERANAAIGLFGTPLEDLSTSDIPDFLDSLSSMDSSLGDVSRTL
jgi:phage-related minor tail protein